MDDKEIFPNSSVDDLKIGDIVLQKYEILSFIASGGGGRVYKAHDNFRDLDVAIKVLLVDQNDQKAHVRFQSEARTASKLCHPNIATIYDFGLFHDKPVLIMEYIDGQSLHDMLTHGEALDLNTFKEIFLQVATAVNHAHKSKIVHRDLKPANIVVSKTSDGKLKPKILDFGIAKSLSADEDGGKLTMTGAIVGSPLYMSPEQASGRAVTLESDLYSLGAIMFRSLTGTPPIQGSTAMETIMLVSSSSPPSISKLVDEGELPKNLCDLIDDLLSTDPSQRPSLQDVVIPTLEKVGEQPEHFDHTDHSSRSNHSDQLHSLISGTESGVKTDKGVFGPALVISLSAIVGLIGIVWYQIHAKSDKLPTENPLVAPVHGIAETSAEIPREDIDRMATVYDAQTADQHQVYRVFTNETLLGIKPPFITSRNSSLTDADLAKIAQPQLFRDIDVSQTKVTSLKELQRFSCVEKLQLEDLKLADGALKVVHKLNLLSSLYLKNTNVKNEDLQHLISLKRLSLLDLDNTKVTPSGVKIVSQLPSLRSLILLNLGFSCEDIRTFVNDLPPFCIVSVSLPEPSEDFLKDLVKEFPDLCFNEFEGADFTEQEQIARLLEKTSAPSCLQAKSRLNKLIERLNQRYGIQTNRTRFLYKELGETEAFLKNHRAAAE